LFSEESRVGTTGPQHSTLPGAALAPISRIWHAPAMSIQLTDMDPQNQGRQPFLDAYAENLTILLDQLDALASELAQVGDYQAASFFSGLSRVVTGFAACHFPAVRLLSSPTDS
jgi:hypothetical protein